MKTFIYLFALFLFQFSLFPEKSFSQDSKEYVCFPCGSDCDNEIHNTGGVCSVCDMQLIEKSRVRFKQITPAELLSKLQNERDYILLDVRTKEEFEGDGTGRRSLPGFKHLKNAVNISSDELEQRLGELEKYKNKEVIVYCTHSRRSPYCSQILTDAGFTDLTNVSTGVRDFVKQY